MKQFLTALALAATPALAQDDGRARITQFNGYSVTVTATVLTPGEVPSWAKAEAVVACGSSGRRAKLQSVTELEDYRIRAFYVCL